MKNKLATRVQAISNDCVSESTGNVKKRVDLTRSLQVKVAALGLAAFVALGAAPSMAQTQSLSPAVQQTMPSAKTVAFKQEKATQGLLRANSDLRSALFHNDSEQIVQAKEQMHAAINRLSDNTAQLKNLAPNTERATVINDRLAQKLDQLSQAVDASVHTYDQKSEIQLTALVAEARGISSRIEQMFPNPWADMEAQVKVEASASSAFTR